MESDSSVIDKSSKQGDEFKLELAVKKLHANETQLHLPDARTRGDGQRLYDWARGTPSFETFLKWIDGTDSRVLWVSGSPGVGKSMLMYAAAQSLETD